MKDTRKPYVTYSERLLLLLMTTFFLSGCQSLPVSYSAGVVPQSKMVQLAESGEQAGRYATEDLEIDYRYVRNQGNLNISGSILFAGRLKYNFTRINNFHADLIFVDEQGRTLNVQGLTSSAFSDSQDPLKFGVTATIPPNAAAIAFSYKGLALSPDSEGGGTDMYFEDYPFR